MALEHRFVKLPHAVIDHADLNAHELLVYLVLHRFRDPKTGKCWPGMSTIADRARVSVNSARKAINGLEAKGIIKVARVKAVGSKTNATNEYTVGLMADDPVRYLGKSAQGYRKPQRRLSEESRALLSESAKKRSDASEVVPVDECPEGSASEVVGSASEVVGVVPPRHTKKNQLKKTKEEDLTRTFKESASESISFDSSEDDLATEKQVEYLKDLAIHQGYEAGYGVLPDDLTMQRWRKLTRREARDLIRSYLKSLGRPDDIYYPQYGTPEYEALSEAGKDFADSGGRPDSVWEHGFKMKEDRA